MSLLGYKNISCWVGRRNRRSAQGGKSKEQGAGSREGRVMRYQVLSVVGGVGGVAADAGLGWKNPGFARVPCAAYSMVLRGLRGLRGIRGI